MVWLFGQIWLWLIIAFLLGALTSWLVLRTAQRPKAEPVPEDHYYDEPEPEPEQLAAEQTQFIPAAWAQHETDRPQAVHDDDGPEPAGHREGHLPMPPQHALQAEDWPTEEEPAWPGTDDLPEATPQWPHQPGRGG